MAPTRSGNLSPVLIAIPSLKLLIQLLAIGGYGIFRGELYYLACTDHLAWGYVDQPPLSILILWITKHLLSDSLFALRLVPALAGAATVLLVGLMTRRFGGGTFAQLVAMLAATFAPVYLALNHIYSMNALEMLFWASGAYVLILLLDGADPRLWLLLGAVLGLGLQNKISVLWLGLGIVVGLAATQQRRLLASPWPWLGGLVAGLIFLPHLLWQAANDWPTLEFMRNATENKMVETSILDFTLGQLLEMGPVTLLVWLPGLFWLLFSKTGRRFKTLGWIYLVVLALLILSGSSRASYLAPAYTWLLAAGGVVWEGLQQNRRWLGVTLTIIVVVGNLVLVPLALPVLPVENYIRYSRALGIGPSTEERKELADLPQFYADMNGWEGMVETLGAVVSGLNPAEQESARILALNYGVAGAIDHFGQTHGLRPAISAHNNYWLWGPGDWGGLVLIVKGGSTEALGRYFEDVEQVATIDCGYCMPYENNAPVFVCREPRMSVDEMWAQLKNYN